MLLQIGIFLAHPASNILRRDSKLTKKGFILNSEQYIFVEWNLMEMEFKAGTHETHLPSNTVSQCYQFMQNSHIFVGNFKSKWELSWKGILGWKSVELLWKFCKIYTNVWYYLITRVPVPSKMMASKKKHFI